jgi:hypothetical protein
LNIHENETLIKWLNNNMKVDVELDVSKNIKNLNYTNYPTIKHYGLIAYNNTGYFYLSVTAKQLDINNYFIKGKAKTNTTVIFKLAGVRCFAGNYSFNFNGSISNFVSRRPIERLYLQEYYQVTGLDFRFNSINQWQFIKR